MGDGSPSPARHPPGERLESWKDIAAYLKRDVRTVQRWEKREGLPVYRHVHERHSSVYAYKPELEAWFTNRRPQLERTELQRAARRPIAWTWLAAAAVVAAAGATAWLAFNTPRTRRTPVVRRLWTGSEISLAPGTLSPDGRFVPFVEWKTGNLALLELATGRTRLLTKNATWTGEYPQGAVFSPDGKLVAYQWFTREWRWELRVVGTDGSAGRVLYRDANRYIRPVDWSRDAKSILVLLWQDAQGLQVGVVGAGDGSLRVLQDVGPDWPRRVLFSPDARWIVYDAPRPGDPERRDLVLLPVSPGAVVRVLQQPGDHTPLDWSPDGARLLFLSDRSGSLDAWTLGIAGGRAVGEPALVRREMGRVYPLGFARDGAYYYEMGGMLDVHLVPLDGTTGKPAGLSRPLRHSQVGSNAYPEWSPDGGFLVYCTQLRAPQAPRTTTLAIHELETGRERQLAAPMSVLPGMRWSPDGRWLLVAGWDRHDRQGLYRIDVQTGSLVLVSHHPGLHIRQGAWLPSGRSILYNGNDRASKGSRLVVRNLRSGQERIVYQGPFIGNIALSPDGGKVAFSSEGRLQILALAGGEPRELWRGPILDVTWTPDGRWLLFSKRRGEGDQDQGTELWRVPAAGGLVENLGLPMALLAQHRVDSAGRFLALTYGTSTAEVWVMENFLPLR